MCSNAQQELEKHSERCKWGAHTKLQSSSVHQNQNRTITGTSAWHCVISKADVNLFVFIYLFWGGLYISAPGGTKALETLLPELLFVVKCGLHKTGSIIGSNSSCRAGWSVPLMWCSTAGAACCAGLHCDFFSFGRVWFSRAPLLCNTSWLIVVQMTVWID